MINTIINVFALIGLITSTIIFGFIIYILINIIREYYFDIKIEVKPIYKLTIELKIKLIVIKFIYNDKGFGVTIYKKLESGYNTPMFVWSFGPTLINTSNNNLDNPFKNNHKFIKVNKIRDFIFFKPLNHITTLDSCDVLHKLDKAKYKNGTFIDHGDTIAVFILDENNNWSFEDNLSIFDVTDNTVLLGKTGSASQPEPQFEVPCNHIPLGQFDT